MKNVRNFFYCTLPCQNFITQLRAYLLLFSPPPFSVTPALLIKPIRFLYSSKLYNKNKINVLKVLILLSKALVLCAEHTGINEIVHCPVLRLKST